MCPLGDDDDDDANANINANTDTVSDMDSGFRLPPPLLHFTTLSHRAQSMSSSLGSTKMVHRWASVRDEACKEKHGCSDQWNRGMRM